jgi:hypothetical protein
MRGAAESAAGVPAMEEVLMGGSGWVAEARRVVVLVVAVLPLAAAGLALVVAPAAQAATPAAHGSVLITSAGASLAAPAARPPTGQAASSIRPARSQSPAAGLCPVVVTLSESSSATFYGFEGAEKFTSHVSVPKSDFCKALPTGSDTISAGGTTVCTIDMSGGVDYCYLPTSTFLGVGSYIVTASYSGDWEYSSATNSGTEVALTVSEQTTATSLALSSPGAVYSQEGSEELSVQVTPQSDGTATGTVVVSASGPTSGTLCTLTLSSGAAHCNLGASQLAAGLYSITATYSGGDPDFAGSTSGEQSLYVGSDATYFVTFNVPGTATYGNEEHTQTFSATVAAVSGTPTGTLAVTDSAGTPLCSFTLSAADDGSGSCSPTNPIAEVPGNYSVIFTFYADAPYVGSVAPSTPWFVAKAHGYPSLSLSASSVAYGNEHSVIFSVKVAPEFTNGGTPTGTVTVEDTNNDVLCTVTLVAAAGSCSTQNTPAGDTALGAGSYQLFASYNGDSNFDGTSGDSPQNFSVSQARTTTGLKLSSSTVTSGHENAERLKVQVKSHYPVALVGQVTIIDKAAHHKAAIVCVVTLNSGNGSCKLKAKALRPGTYELTATYGGSSDILTSTSPKKKLTVRK